MPASVENPRCRALSAQHYQPLVIVLAAAAFGILLDRYWPLPFWALWSMAAAALAAWGALIRWKPTSQSIQTGNTEHSPITVWGSLAIALAVVFAAGAWHHCRWNLFAADDLGRYARPTGQPVCVEAIARGIPRLLPPPPADPMQVTPSVESWRFDIDLLALRNGVTWQAVSGRAAMLVQGAAPDVAPGDRLLCFGRLTAPLPPQNPGELDRAAQSRARRVLCQIDAQAPECISVLESGPTWRLARLLEYVRDRGREVLRRCLDSHQAELASAALLGLREELDLLRTENFMTTGTIHLLCISGLHLGILAGALGWIMLRTPIPRGWAAIVVAVFVVCYALTVDVRPSVVRATTLVLIGCAAYGLHRRPLGPNSLAAAALVVLALNPADLFHVGAQLSFLCVAGLIWIAARRPHGDSTEASIQRLVRRNLGWWWRIADSLWRSCKGIVLAGMVLWLLTTPLVMARFHVFSPVSIILNALLWLPMSLGLLSGFGALVCGSIWLPLGYLSGWVCEKCFWLVESCVDWAARLPGSHFWVPGPSDWWLWGFLGFLGATLVLPQSWLPPRRCVAALAGWVAVGFGVACWPRPCDRLDCTFLSVGHGCAVLVELPAGETMLYDAGRFGAPRAGVRTIAEFLWSRGLMHIDAVVLSHPDMDHYNALPGLLERFSVGAVYVSPMMFERPSQTLTALRQSIEEHNTPLLQLRAGDCLRVGAGCAVEVLHPPKYGVLGSDNANSIVLVIKWLGREILLPGDLESPGLDDLLAEEPRRTSVLLAPHHGSRKSNLPAMAQWCRPDLVVVSGDNRWFLPEIDAAYEAVGSQVLHTCQGGAISVHFTQEGGCPDFRAKKMGLSSPSSPLSPSSPSAVFHVNQYVHSGR